MATVASKIKDLFTQKPESVKHTVATVEESEQVGAVMELLEDARRHKEKWTAPWAKSFEYYMGRQWGRVPPWKATVTANLIHSTVETAVSMMNQGSPTVDLIPMEPGTEEYVRLVQKDMDAEMDMQDLLEEMVRIDKNCAIFGKGFWYIWWDKKIGSPCAQSVDPHYIFMDPGARSIKKARYVIYVCQMTRAELVADYPDAVDKVYDGHQMVKVADDYLVNGPGLGQADRAYYAYKLDSNGQSTREVGRYLKTGDADMANNMIQVFKVWIRDSRSMLFDVPDMGDGQTYQVQRPIYPGGRHMVIACNRVITDGPNDYLHGEIPIVEQDGYVVSGTAWSKSLVQDALSLQDEINKTISHIVDHRNHVGNPQRLIHTGSGIETEKLSDRPGLNIETNMMDGFQYIQPPTLPSNIPDILFMSRQLMEATTNVNSAVQGRSPGGGVTSGVAIERLQDQANVALSFLIMQKEQSLKNMGRQWLALKQQFQKESRFVTMTDPETGRVQVMEVTPEMIQKKWGIKIVRGSTIPISRDTRLRYAETLMKLGVLDEQGTLEFLNIPGVDEILTRVQARRKAEMEMQMQIAEAQALGASGQQGLGGSSGGPGGSPPSGQAPGGPPSNPEMQAADMGADMGGRP